MQFSNKILFLQKASPVPRMGPGTCIYEWWPILLIVFILIIHFICGLWTSCRVWYCLGLGSVTGVIYILVNCGTFLEDGVCTRALVLLFIISWLIHPFLLSFFYSGTALDEKPLCKFDKS